MALLGPTRLLISEKSTTYTIKWIYTIIWQVRVNTTPVRHIKLLRSCYISFFVEIFWDSLTIIFYLSPSQKKSAVIYYHAKNEKKNNCFYSFFKAVTFFRKIQITFFDKTNRQKSSLWRYLAVKMPSKFPVTFHRKIQIYFFCKKIIKKEGASSSKNAF